MFKKFKEWVAKQNVKQWFYRAWRTFIQAAVSYIAGNLVVILADVQGAEAKTVIIGAITTAGSYGLAAVMNMKKTETSQETTAETIIDAVNDASTVDDSEIVINSEQEGEGK